LQSKKNWPRPFECFVWHAPFPQHALPPSQHWPLQPVAGPAGQLHVAPAPHVPPAQAMQVLPHGIWPVGHWQVPPEHVAPVGQAWPHEPQFCVSVANCTHALGH
jgi:hypothetical protein